MQRIDDAHENGTAVLEPGRKPSAVPPRVLLVDDQKEVLRALRRELRDLPVTFDECATGAAALDCLNRHDYALIITDNSMPGMTGIELLQQAGRFSPNTSRIVLSGYDDLKHQLSTGSKDVQCYFLGKPWNRAELLQQVMRALEEYRLRTENGGLREFLRTREEQLRMQAEALDRLSPIEESTGLFKRDEFLPAVERQVKLCKRDHQPFSLALASLTGPSPLTGAAQSSAAAAAVLSMATVLRSCLRAEVDTSFHLSEREFAVLMRATREEQALVAMSRIRSSLRSEAGISGGSEPQFCAVVAEYDGESAAPQFLSIPMAALAAARRFALAGVLRVADVPAT